MTKPGGQVLAAEKTRPIAAWGDGGGHRLEIIL